jgi:hypothetical protein
MKQWKKTLGTLMFLLVLIITLSLHGTAFSQETTRVFVYPAEIVATTCGTQTVEVRVEDVVDLTGYHLEISFDPDVIEVTDVVNGGFLAPPGESALYEPTNEIDNVHGLITFGLVQQGDGTGDPLPKSGDGALLEITFQAVVPNETSDITIDAVNSILVNWPDVSPIDFTTSDGSVTTESCSPTGMDIIDNWIPENEPVGTEVGIFYTIDPDVPNDSFTYELVSGVGGDDNDSFEIEGSSLKTKEVFNYEEQMIHRIRVRSTDWGGKTFEKAFLIFVLDVNDAPVAVGKDVSTTQETPIDITLTGLDEDGDELTFEIISGPDNGTLTGTAPHVTYTPDDGYVGEDSFTFRVFDGEEYSDPATVNISVAESEGWIYYLPIILN